MRPDKHRVRLSERERHELKEIVSKGEASARKIRRAHILLKADAGWTDEAISVAMEVSRQTVYEVRKQCVQDGMSKTIQRTSGRIAGSQSKTLDGVAEAHLVALTCSEPPEGQDRWTLRLLAHRMVTLTHVEAVSYETVRRVLKKTNLSLGVNRPGASHLDTMLRL